MNDPAVYFTTEHKWLCCDHRDQILTFRPGVWLGYAPRHKRWCPRRCPNRGASQAYVCELDRNHSGECSGYFARE